MKMTDNKTNEHLINENKRLVNQLLISTKYVNKLIEFKNTFNLYSIKFKQCLELNEWQKFEKLFQEINEINNSNEDNIEEITNDIKSEPIKHSIDLQFNPMKSTEESDHLIQSLIDDESNRLHTLRKSPMKKKIAVPVDSKINLTDKSRLQIISCPESECNYKSYVLFNIRIHQKITHGLDVDFSDEKSDQKTSQTSVNDKRELMRQKMALRQNVVSVDSGREQIKSLVNGCGSESDNVNTMSSHSCADQKRQPCPTVGQYSSDKKFNAKKRSQSCRAIQTKKRLAESSGINGIKIKRMVRYKCSFDDCRREFPTNTKLKHHIQYKHLKDSNEMLKCRWNGCQYETQNPEYMSRHVDNCHKEKKFVCDYPGCGHKCYKEYRLKIHQRIHSDVKPFACDWPGCQFRSAVKLNLKHHMESHTNSGSQYECTVDGCHKTFKSRFGISYHTQTVHNRSKGLQCEWPGCDYKTYTKFRLNTHRMIHTNEKPHACQWPECQYQCRTNENLKRHMKVHKTLESN